MTHWGERGGGLALTSESTATRQSLIHILTRAATLEGTALRRREMQGQWSLQRRREERSCKNKDDSSRLWGRVERKPSP